ncbi:MAG: hypothetical protein LBD51_03405, partial [Bifidobacteriaceae bacterium]|nr:hypothetical protein [Bifidobacteriaceae bacterium]
MSQPAPALEAEFDQPAPRLPGGFASPPAAPARPVGGRRRAGGRAIPPSRGAGRQARARHAASGAWGGGQGAGRALAARVVTTGGLALALACGLGLAVLPGGAATAAADSSLTLSWAGGNPADVQEYQPARDPESVHYQDFKDVQVTVSQTQDLVDQVVQVEVTGMPGAT